MNSKMLALVAAAATAIAAPATATTYMMNLSGGGVSAVGSIETDGTLGTLVRANVTDWNVTITDALGSITLNGPSNSELRFFSAPLTATATGLFFNFSGSGAVVFQNPQVGSGVNFLCFTGNLLCGGGYYRTSISVSNFGGGIAQSGVQQIAGAAAVPEPASWAMMIGGLGLAGVVLRRRRRAVKTIVRFA